MSGQLFRCSKRRVRVCQKVVVGVIILITMLSFLVGEITNSSLFPTDHDSELGESNSDLLLSNQEEHFSNDFVVVSSNILRRNWRKRVRKEINLKANTSFKNKSTVQLKVRQPQLILYRPAKQQPSDTVSVLKHRTRLIAYLNKLPSKPTVNDKGNSSLIQQSPYEVLLTQLNHSAILTLFTTLKLKEDNLTLHMTGLVLNQWSKLKPWVNLILFLDKSDIEVFKHSNLSSLAKSLGWKVMPILHEINGLPVVKHMYLTALKSTDESVPFIAYANSDIIFETDLIKTLSFIWNVTSRSIIEKGCLFVGKRSPVSLYDFEKKILSFGKRKAATFKSNLIKDADYSFDYFITTRNGFKWEQTPDFVVGKPGYDAWIVVMGQEWDLVTIDLTQSVTAYHIVAGNNLFPEKGWMASDVCINRELVDPFDYKRAHTHCARLFTVPNILTKSTVLQLYQRNKLQPVCYTNTDPQLRELAAVRYPGCQQTAEIKRSKLKNDIYVEELIAKLDNMIKLHNMSDNNNLTQVIM